MKTALTRWTPSFSRSALDRAFESAFNDMLRPVAESEELQNRSWIPAVDIRESAESLTLTADLPGLSQEDIELTLENNLLTLTGERRFEAEDNTKDYHRIERAYGRFTRSFTLPRNVESDSVKASFQNGVLTIELPKKEQAKARRIDIS